MSSSSTYELTVVYSPELTDIKQKKELTSLEALVKKNKGKVIKNDHWGKKPLAYPMKKHEEGYYAHYLVELAPEGPENITSELKVNGQVLRYLLVKPIKPKKKKAKVKKKSKKLDKKES